MAASTEYPVVTVFGPRQSGKTTLVQAAFPNKKYASMEDPDVRRAAELDPREFLDFFPDGAILDEIQRTPQLLSYIQGIVDRKKSEGMFILTGSHQPALHNAVSQSLAGRTAVLTLYPFSLEEISLYNKKIDVFSLVHSGCFPRLHEKMLKPHRFFNGYVQTYLERDVRSITNVQDIGRFQQFLTLLAGRTGQLINFASLSNDSGVSPSTVKNWISILKASYVVCELQPYFQNIGKRVMKSPKIYFTDTGLACYLLGITDADQLKHDPLRGNLFENFLILEFFKNCYNTGKPPVLFFYRDSHGNEVDLLISKGRSLVPIEIKSASTFDESFLKGIDRFKEAVGPERYENGAILYNGDMELSIRGISVFNPFHHQRLSSFLAPHPTS
jgi:predicted AAA+ superfamily ATPase